MGSMEFVPNTKIKLSDWDPKENLYPSIVYTHFFWGHRLSGGDGRASLAHHAGLGAAADHAKPGHHAGGSRSW